MTIAPGTAAPLQALAFLGTIALTALCLLVGLGALVARRRTIVRLAGATLAVAIGAYALTLLALGAASREHVLGPGEAKVFCELDCHLAYTVPRARRVDTVPGLHARGVFYVVTVRTTFDERTIAPWRGDAPLLPNPRRLRLVDSTGRAWPVDVDAQRALAAAGLGGTPLDTPLRPGESYESTFVFDVPPSIEAPRLAITEADAVTHVLLGHENSPFHAKTVFALGRGFVVGR